MFIWVKRLAPVFMCNCDIVTFSWRELVMLGVNVGEWKWTLRGLVEAGTMIWNDWKEWVAAAVRSTWLLYETVRLIGSGRFILVSSKWIGRLLLGVMCSVVLLFVQVHCCSRLFFGGNQLVF